MQHEPGVLIQLLPLILMGIAASILSFNLAKAKGYSAVKFTILGLIPIVNWFTTAYLIGAPDRVLRARLDALLPANATRKV
jgi:hypothetical protein